MIKTFSNPQRFMRSACNAALSVFLLVYLTVIVMGVVSADSDQQNAEITDGFTLIELYTSLGCSSCPPADKYLGELLADNDELMALEFHVDYWNTLVHGKDGNFVDPYSEHEYSMRQRNYNLAGLSGRPGVYTPQMVINGRVAMVGSNRRYSERILKKQAQSALTLGLSPSTDAAFLDVQLSVPEDRAGRFTQANVMLARYLDKTETNVTGGENNKKLLVNHHVVISFELLGKAPDSGELKLRIASPESNEGCVVLVQDEQLRALYAAAACP